MKIQELNDLVGLIEARAKYTSYFGEPEDLEIAIILQNAFIKNHITTEETENPT